MADDTSDDDTGDDDAGADTSDDAFTIPVFGTDGLRGRAGNPPLDPRTLRRVGAALGLWLQRGGSATKRVAIADDGRDSAPWILDSLALGLASAECTAVDLGLLTTPALAHLTRTGRFVAGIMISASHNPATDNGIKIFTGDGGKLPDDVEGEIAALTARLDVDPTRNARPRPEPELRERYLADLFDVFCEVDLAGATIVVDAANGGAAELAPTLLRRMGADVVEIACEPDGTNINEGCGALHPERAVETVRASSATLGICLDGDGDRCIFVDDRGTVHDGDSVLATLGPHLLSAGRLRGARVVTTVMSNLALRRVLAGHGIDVVATPVGDRHVARAMRELGASLGAEPSGHVLFDRGDHLVGDGLFTALTVLGLPDVVRRGSSHAFAHFERFPQLLVNVRVARKPELDGVAAIAAARDAAIAELGDDGRVVLRYSGTEDLCRVMVEGPSRDVVERLVLTIVDAVRRELS